MDIDRLKEVLLYEPHTGKLFWKFREGTDAATLAFNGRNAGKEAGCFKPSTGRGTVEVDETPLQVHRVAWAIYYGEWPKLLIDHRDGNPRNNIITNLREATSSQNAANKAGHAKSGLKGVHPAGKKWQSSIMCKGKSYYLGVFETPEEAHAAYKLMAITLHGEFARFDTRLDSVFQKISRD